MAGIPAKKMMILNILEVLKHHSDDDHRLTQKDIISYLQNDYNMSADRKAIKRNLLNLLDCDEYQVECDSEERQMANGETEIVCSDWYLLHDFTVPELRLIIDSLLFSRQIPSQQKHQLIEKLEKLQSEYFKSHMRHIEPMPHKEPENKDLFYTIEILDEAIIESRQVSFEYGAYGADLVLHSKLDEDGKPRRYLINPVQIVASNGRYYLICNNDRYDNLANYRLDKILNIEKLETPRKKNEAIPELKNGLSLPQHMAEHIYMFSGESTKVGFETTTAHMGDVVDWCGSDIRIEDLGEDRLRIFVMVNKDAMRHWVLQYGKAVKVVSPASFVQDIEEDIRELAKKYRF